MKPMKSYRFIISGRVQGVWYRRSIQVGANMAGFSGYVRNLPEDFHRLWIAGRIRRFVLLALNE